MAFFTGQQAHAGVTGRGSTPSICAVSRQQGDSAVAPASRSTRGGQSEVPRRSFALSRASRGTARLHRPAGVQGADRARFHAAHLRCLAPAGGTARLHRPAGARGCNRARFHAVYPRGPASAGGWRLSPVSRRTRGGQSEVPRRLPARSHVGREDGAFHRSAGARGCDGARFHAVYPRCPTSAGRMAFFTGQQAHAGVTGRGSTPSTRAVPRRLGGWRFSPVSRRTRV
jgi:hypothetical protein